MIASCTCLPNTRDWGQEALYIAFFIILWPLAYMLMEEVDEAYQAFGGDSEFRDETLAMMDYASTIGIVEIVMMAVLAIAIMFGVAWFWVLIPLGLYVLTGLASYGALLFMEREEQAK